MCLNSSKGINFNRHRKELVMAKEKKTATSVQEAPTAPTVSQGNVKWFDWKKGYGFITCAASGGGEVDVFVHQTSIQMEGFRTLYEDEAVRFEAVPGKKDGQWEAK